MIADIDPGKSVTFSEEKLLALVKTFFTTDYQSLLISSEFFFMNIEKIHEVLSKIEGIEHFFIVYMRNPIDSMESNYNQGVKRSGFTDIFTLPKHQAIGQINRIGQLAENRPLIIRPYLYQIEKDWSLIKDFSDIVGIPKELFCDDDSHRVINSSYCYEALEYKRFLNNFDLSTSQADLDRALQAYKGKITKYSFITESDYDELRKECLEQLEHIKFGQENVFNLIFQASDKKQRLDQGKIDISDELLNISHYIKNINPDLYHTIKTTLETSNLSFLYPDIVKVFEIDEEDLKTPKEYRDRFSKENLQQMQRSLSSNPNFHLADLARELGILFEKEKEYEIAASFMMHARKARPNAPFINKKLKSYLKHIEKQTKD